MVLICFLYRVSKLNFYNTLYAFKHFLNTFNFQNATHIKKNFSYKKYRRYRASVSKPWRLPY